MSLSLDGYFEGPNHDISWHNVDDEFNTFAIEQLKETDLFLWGRRIYQLMESYWPKAAEDQTTSADNREIARLMNSTEKIVFSRTLGSVSETKELKKRQARPRIRPCGDPASQRTSGQGHLGGRTQSCPVIHESRID
jgi:dihydrofolate reductase